MADRTAAPDLTRVRHLLVDRDGVLNREPPGGYVLEVDAWAWYDGALDALARLTTAGIRVSVFTNQSCIGQGLVSAPTVDAVHDRMRREAATAGATIAAVYLCPHLPDDGCSCRKPRPGMIEQALADSGIPALETLAVGDRGRDLEAARAVGVPAALVLTGHGRETLAEATADGAHVFADLGRLADAVLAR